MNSEVRYDRDNDAVHFKAGGSHRASDPSKRRNIQIGRRWRGAHLQGLRRSWLRRPCVWPCWAKLLREGPGGTPGAFFTTAYPAPLADLKNDGSLGLGVSAFLVPTGSLG